GARVPAERARHLEHGRCELRALQRRGSSRSLMASLDSTSRARTAETQLADDRADRWARWLSAPMLVVALLVVPAVVIEESSVGPTWHSVAVDLNWVVWLAFAGELVWLLWLAPDKRRWLREHPLDVAIVVLTPP